MKPTFAILNLACFLLASCSSATTTVSMQQLTIQYTAASIPWLADLTNCAGANVVNAEQRAADFLDPQVVDMALRIGQPDTLASPAFQIGSEEILVIVNSQNPINHLTLDQVRGLFSGQILNWQEVNGSNDPVQVWVFATGEDVQRIFEQSVLGGSPVTSTARLATDMEEMSQAIADDMDAVGILPRHWNMGNVSDVFTVATVPVLALTEGEPQGAVEGLLACLQGER